jgi:signal peptidase II
MQAARGTSITAHSQPIRRRRLAFRLLFLVVALAGLLGDVITKMLVVDRLEPSSPVRLLGGVLTLRLIRNPGAAFSLGERFTFVFALLSAGVLVFVVLKLAPMLGHAGWAVALGLLCAGVSGNLTDRLFRAPGFLRGHVVDFLQLPRWPIFNVADICITSAAVLIMFLSVVKNISINGERYQKPVDAEAKSEPGG